MTRLPLTMNERDFKNAQAQISRLAGENFKKDNISLLFSTIREFLNQRSFLRELCHFVGHSQRDRGITYDATIAKAKIAFNVIKNGGKLSVHGVYDKDIIFAELISFLKLHNFKFDEKKIIINKYIFFEALYKFLDGVKIKVLNDREIDVISLELFKPDNNICFVIKSKIDIQGVIRMPKNVQLAFGLFK